jgi:hypothetical protein
MFIHLHFTLHLYVLINVDFCLIFHQELAEASDIVAYLSKGMPETPRAQGGPRSDTRDLWRQW